MVDSEVTEGYHAAVADDPDRLFVFGYQQCRHSIRLPRRPMVCTPVERKGDHIMPGREDDPLPVRCFDQRHRLILGLAISSLVSSPVRKRM